MGVELRFDTSCVKSTGDWRETEEVAVDRVILPELTCRKQRVSFSSQVNKVVLPSTNLTAKQIQTMWYSKDDIQTMKKLAKKDRYDERAGMDSNNLHLACTDGLKSSSQSFTRSRIVRHATQSVLNEQDWQRAHNMNEPEGIAQRYSHCCSLSQWEAVDRATWLAKDVQKLNANICTKSHQKKKRMSSPFTTSKKKSSLDRSPTTRMTSYWQGQPVALIA